MRPRWNWDFEDEQRPAGPVSAPPRPPAPPPPAAPPPPPRPAPPARDERSRRMRVHTRRGIAALVVVLLVALAIALSGSSRHAARATGARGAAAGHSAVPAPSPPSEEQAIAATLAFTPFVREGTRAVRDVALTFDDGPGPYTPALLSVLEAAHVRATFFAIGRMERYFSASTEREFNDGDVVGDHTESHVPLARLSAAEQREQIFEARARLEILGRRPRLFRPPYGSFDAATFRQLKSLGMLMVLWSADTGDYLQPGVPAIVQRALEGAHPGAIILMHDGGGVRSQTVEALPVIIRELHARGYRLVTVPQLLADDPPPRGLPLPTSLAGD
jgi:peptidoglycan/xylan/chitin deacetylase (PgdA/CDA1 family)